MTGSTASAVSVVTDPGASITTVHRVIYELPIPGSVPSSTLGNLFGYQGRPIDPETGLVYFRNRYYDPELGRFINADPLGYVDGPSR